MKKFQCRAGVGGGCRVMMKRRLGPECGAVMEHGKEFKGW